MVADKKEEVKIKKEERVAVSAHGYRFLISWLPVRKFVAVGRRNQHAGTRMLPGKFEFVFTRSRKLSPFV